MVRGELTIIVSFRNMIYRNMVEQFTIEEDPFFFI